MQVESDVESETETLWETVKGDFSQATGVRIIGVALLLTWLAFQWGWGNDILLPPIVARAYEAVDNGATWASGIGAVAAAVGAGGLFWGATQAFDGIVVLAGLRLVPGITGRISRFLRRQGWVKPYHELSIGTRFLIAYLSGASVLCLVDVFATGRQGLRSRWRMLAQAVALAVAGVATIIAVVTIAIAVGARIPATEGASEFVIRYARNPLTWLVIYGGAILLSHLVGRLASTGGKAARDGASGNSSAGGGAAS